MGEVGSSIRGRTASGSRWEHLRGVARGTRGWCVKDALALRHQGRRAHTRASRHQHRQANILAPVYGRQAHTVQAAAPWPLQRAPAGSRPPEAGACSRRTTAGRSLAQQSAGQGKGGIRTGGRSVAANLRRRGELCQASYVTLTPRLKSMIGVAAVASVLRAPRLYRKTPSWTAVDWRGQRKPF